MCGWLKWSTILRCMFYLIFRPRNHSYSDLQSDSFLNQYRWPMAQFLMHHSDQLEISNRRLLSSHMNKKYTITWHSVPGTFLTIADERTFSSLDLSWVNQWARGWIERLAEMINKSQCNWRSICRKKLSDGCGRVKALTILNIPLCNEVARMWRCEAAICQHNTRNFHESVTSIQSDLYKLPNYFTSNRICGKIIRNCYPPGTF